MSESLRDLVVSLSLDSDNFSRNIKSIQQQIKEAESGFRAAGAGVNGFEDTISGAQAKLAMLEQKFQLQQQAVQQYERALTAAQGKLEKSAQTQDKLSQKLEAAKQHHAELADRIDQLKQSMRELNDEGQSGTAAYAEMQAELEALQAEYAANGQEVSKLEQQLSRNAATMQRNADAVTRAQTNLNNANAGLQETQNQIAQVRSHLEQLQNVLVNAGNKLVQFGEQAKNIGSAIEGIGKKMSVLSAAVIAAGTKSVQTFTSYDDAIRQVYATMGLSAEENAAQMAALDAAAQEMGKNTKYHAMEAAEALNYLALAGYDADKAIATLPRVLSLAQAGGMDLATASDMVTDNMSALGIATNQVEQFIDQMAVTAQKSNTSVAQLGEGVQAVSGAAKNLKGGTVELNTALGVMADNGIKGAEGGKHLRNVILSLQSPTKEAADQLAAMKIQVYDAAGNMRGLDEIFSDMSASMAGWTQQAKDQAISKIFNKTDLTAVNALISNCGARWQELSGYIAESDGAAQKMGETMEGGIGGSFRSLSSAIESLGIKFGETLVPTVQAVADRITDLVRRFSELDESSKQRIVTIAAVVAAAGPAVLIIGKITSGVGTMIGAFGKGMIAISKIPKLISSTTTTISAFGSKAADTFKTFQRTATEAGGGMQGFLTALKGSPTLMATAAAACAYLAYKFIDFVSGAKAAREAQERLNATVKEWNEDVTTAFEKAEGLSAFQLSADDFKVDGADSVTNWLESTIATWTDGKAETQEILDATVSGFTDYTDAIRSNLTQLRESTGGDLIGDLDGDIERLDKIDKEVESILTKKQNGYLSDDEIARLQSLMDERDAIKIKYQLVTDSDDAFQSILDGVDAALSRGAQGADTFNNAFAAATQGFGAFTDSLYETYDARYKAIQAMEDGDAKVKAMDELTAWYEQQADAARQQYYNTIMESADKTGMFADGGQYSETIGKLQQINALMQAAAGKDSKAAEVTALRDALAGLDETGIVEMNAAVQAMIKAAEEAGEEVPESVQAASDALAAVKDTSITADDLFPDDVAESVKSMFSGIDGETTEVYATLNCDALATAYDAWAAGVHADIIPSITTDPIQTTLTETPFTFEASGDVPEGKITTPTGDVFTVNGSGIVTNAEPAAGTTCTVLANGDIQYATADGRVFIVDAEGKLKYVDPNGQTFTVDGNGRITSINVDPNAEAPEIEVKAKITQADFESGTFTDSATPDKEYRAGVQKESRNLLGLTDFTASGTYEQLENMAQAVRDYNAALAEYDAASADFNANGTPDSFMRMQELEPVIANCASSIATIGDSLGKEAGYNGGMGFEAMAQTVANGLQLLSNGELDSADTEKLTGIITDLQTVLSSDLAADSSWADNLGVSFQEGLSNAFNNNEGWSTTADNVLATITGAFSAASTQMNAVGGDLSSGIGDGMANQDMSGYAATTITKTESSLRDASDSHSPAGITKPLGSDISAGIGVGMMQYEFASSAAGVASKIRSALQQKLTAASMRSIGKFAMLGLAAGITSGTSSVTSAMRIAAQKAVRAAKAALVIKSPSHVFRDEVGVMMMRGIGDGVLGEAKNQARIIGNAAKYMTGEARSAVMAAPMNDNRRTYNDSSSVNVYVDHLSAQDQHSIFELANEIAALTRRQQQGKGNRKA